MPFYSVLISANSLPVIENEKKKIIIKREIRFSNINQLKQLSSTFIALVRQWQNGQTS